ncbi:tripartite tricarboxylate transporter substrate-binding protein [Devosia algicola]|uniref:Tripartite tricarboxylate transporter substrate-binding protein n=1 Tax=Devosia algicola TaxID=3026418 RepID=A0ABY7YKS3_9HYPH|nr:tripartite tricarboxylate transporter substrate-binding protein [Devosia algicola]WDR01575.1 tripartite tricarboxylate transporter substrate-binding protein [Devosia algicola]
MRSLVDAAKAAPDTIPAAASGSGSIHHLNLLALENGTDAKFRFVPYQGSAPAMEAAVNGEVQLVIGSLAEQFPLIDGGKLKPLAMLSGQEASIGDKTIPDALSEYPSLKQYLPLSQSIGFAVANSASDDVKNVLSEAFTQAMASDTVREWADGNHYVISGQMGDEASKTFAKLESVFAWTLWDLGAATVDPETLGIPKP